MIRSMTGYGRAEVSGPRLTVWAEAKSLNHRTLDVNLRLPRLFSAFELDTRRLVQSSLQRGRVEVTVGLGSATGGGMTPVGVNLEQAREYARLATEVAGALGLGRGPELEWVLGQPGVLSREEPVTLTPEEAWPLLAEALGGALAQLVARREAEGQALAEDLLALHATLVSQASMMAERVPAALDRHTARLRERIQALLAETPIDEARLATEVALWAGRTDVTEELTRLRVHLHEMARLLREGGLVGRTLDFLIQEINRELNTIGSKADDLELSQLVIAGKSALEKLREQVQNLE
jgi:uncharacterized protein (TIGR00255 family)